MLCCYRRNRISKPPDPTQSVFIDDVHDDKALNIWGADRVETGEETIPNLLDIAANGSSAKCVQIEGKKVDADG